MTTHIPIIAPEFYKHYIDLVQQDDVQTSLLKNAGSFYDFLNQVPSDKIDYAYAPGKWTIKEVLQHITDAERVFAYRALWFARKDPNPLPGFDENAWAVHASVSGRNWDEMKEEFKYVRKATGLLFGSFGEEELKAEGISNNNRINVTALGYVCAGHVEHHMNVLRERYLGF